MTTDTKFIVGIGILTVIALVGIGVLSSNSTPSNSEPIKVDKGELVRPDSHSIGLENAKVTLVEFADFQCPACGTTHPILKQIINEYQDRILFVYRQFPLPTHSNAELAAQASEAAYEQGKFWEMHNKLYETQAEWENLKNPESTFIKYAQDLEIDGDKFKQTLKEQKVIDRIRLDKGDGEALEVNSTPTLFINKQKYQGQITYIAIKQIIDQILQTK